MHKQIISFGIFFCFLAGPLKAQKILELDITRFNHFKKIQIFSGDVIEYKLKGEHRFHLGKISNLVDSMIVLGNDSVIKLKEIKILCIRKSNYVLRKFTTGFMIAGVGFFMIDGINNLANNHFPIVDERTIIVSASLVAASLIVRQIGIRKHHIGKNKFLRIIDMSSQHIK